MCICNSKKFWDTVKSMENKSTSFQLPNAMRLGNTVTTDKSTIIENFNKHFSTAVHAFHLATPTLVNCPAPPTATCRLHFSFTQIQIADVLKDLQNLDPYKSAGLDNLDPLFLKWSAEIVATPITSLFKLFRIVWDSHRLESCRGHPPLQRGRHSTPKLLQTYMYSTLPF